MKNRKPIKKINKSLLIALSVCLCACIGFTSMLNQLSNKANALAVPAEINFGWDGENGLGAKLDKYSSNFNAKRGDSGSDTILANADGGLTNAALVGNGSVGAVFGGSSAGQSINIGVNDFWNGQYDAEKVQGIMPQTVGSVGYNIVDPANKANADIDLATTYKNATASSSDEGFSAEAAVSGDYVSNAFWGMGWRSLDGAGRNSWIKLEFDSEITFNRIVLWNAASCMLDGGLDISPNPDNNGIAVGIDTWNTNAFRIEVSATGAEDDWTAVFTEKDNYQPIYDRDLTKAAKGKFVRLFITKPTSEGPNQARICKFSLFANAKNDKNLMPQLVNGGRYVPKGNGIKVSSTCVPDAGQDAPHIYTCSNIYATVCGTQQHLAGYGSWGYGWYTDPSPSGDWIQYALNKETTFKSYQLFNGSASTANAYNRSDWRGWKLETSKDGQSWQLAHEVKPDENQSSPAHRGQSAINSYDIPDVSKTTDIKFIKLTIAERANDSRALLSQFKIYADTLENSGIMTGNNATFSQNIKEGKVGADCTYNGQSYTSRTALSQNSDNYMVTEFKNNSNKPLTMRYYTSAHHYRNPSECQTAGVSEDKKILYSTRTTATAPKDKVAWVSAATIAARIEGDAVWANTLSTAGEAYGDITIAANSTARIITYVDGKQYNEVNYPDYYKINAENAPSKQNAFNKLTKTVKGADIIAASTAYWKEFWQRSYVDVYDETVEKFYYNSIYIVGCASREDNVPTSLFGPFTTSDSMAWGGTYVADYNLYGAYMAVASSNRAELLKPLVRNALESWGGIEGIGNGIGKDYADRFNDATNRNFRNADGTLMFKNGVDGVLSAVVSGPHGYACSIDGFYQILFTNAYAAIPVLSYYDMTQGTGEIADGVVLTQETEYRYLKDVMALWEQILIYENGVYKVKYDGAWEAEPNNMGNAFSLAGIHMFTKRLISDAEALGITEDDEPRLLKWAHIDANLEDYPTAMVTRNENGSPVTRQCYSDTLTTAQKNHVTYNGKTGDGGGSNPNVVVAQVIPTGELGLYSDPAEKQIMRNSLVMLKSWDNINAMPTIFSTAARVGFSSNKYGNNSVGADRPGLDGGVETLMQQLRKTANGGLVQNNVSNLVDPLQLIDTSGGAQGVNDILVQTFKGITTLFPSYEADKAGKFVNLQAQGGFLYSGEQNSSGKVTFAKVTSKFGGRVTFAVPQGANWDFVDSNGTKVEESKIVRSNVGEIVGFDVYKNIKTISFDTVKGVSYYMIPKTTSANSANLAAAEEIAYLPSKED